MFFRVKSPSTNSAKTEKNRDDPINDEPVKFTGSRADYDAGSSFISAASSAPNYQRTSVLFSLLAFMIYFCMLREENDIDEYLNESFIHMDPYGEAMRLQQQLASEVVAGVDTTLTRQKLTYVQSIISATRGDTGSLDATLKQLKAAKHEKKSVFEVK